MADQTLAETAHTKNNIARIFEVKTSIAALHDFWKGEIVWVGVSNILVDARAAACSGKVDSSRLR